MTEVPLQSDWEFTFTVSARTASTGKSAPATGLTNVQAWFSATQGGAALGGTATTLAERSGTPGEYSGIVDVTDVTTALTPYVNSTVYEVFSRAGDVLACRRVLVVPVQAIAEA